MEQTANSQTRSGDPGRVCSFRANLLTRAFDYPYNAPSTPLHFHQGRAGPLTARGVRVSGRLVAVQGVGLCAPVLAVGSNAAVSVLRRKFGVRPVDIIQGRVRLSGHDKVHSAHIARYGAMPATLIKRPGANTRAHLQLVPVQHIEALDATEAVGTNYDRVWLEQRIEVPWLGRRLEGVWTYRSRHGAAMRDREVMALGSQKHALAHAAECAGWQLELDAFVYLMVRDVGFRGAVTQALKNEQTSVS
ncbi:MAG: hypothetical protein AAF234_19300 [Pseudomonadota bacterium]